MPHQQSAEWKPLLPLPIGVRVAQQTLQAAAAVRHAVPQQQPPSVTSPGGVADTPDSSAVQALLHTLVTHEGGLAMLPLRAMQEGGLAMQAMLHALHQRVEHPLPAPLATDNPQSGARPMDEEDWGRTNSPPLLPLLPLAADDQLKEDDEDGDEKVEDDEDDDGDDGVGSSTEQLHVVGPFARIIVFKEIFGPPEAPSAPRPGREGGMGSPRAGDPVHDASQSAARLGSGAVNGSPTDDTSIAESASTPTSEATEMPPAGVWVP